MKKFVVLAVLALIGLSTAAQTQDWAKFTRYKESNEKIAASGVAPKVVFMGDSITEGWFRKNPDFFTSNNFAGRGISGQTSSQMLVRFRDDVIALNPKTVVILAGTNDLALNNGIIEIDNVVGNVISMCELAKLHKIRPVICSVLPATSFSWRPEAGDRSKDIIELNAKLEDYAKSHHIKYVDYHSALKDAADGLAAPYGDARKNGSDSVHPGLDGYKVMEEIILKALK